LPLSQTKPLAEFNRDSGARDGLVVDIAIARLL
jgi:hypothetical protein